MSEAPCSDDIDPGVDAARLAQLHRLDRDHPLTQHEPARTPLESLHHDVSPLTARQRRVRSHSYRARLPRQSKGLHDTDRSAVLADASQAAQLQIAAQTAQLVAANRWAAQHTSLDGTAHGDPSEGGEQLVALAGEGAPLVAEFAVPELALALGVSTDSGRALMTDALELAHRLPGCWSALLAGGIPVFKARRVAHATRDLSPAAATHVDDAVAPYLHAIGVKALDEVVEKAIWTHDLPRALAEAARRLDQRGITIDLDTPLSPPDSPVDDQGPATAAVCQVFGYLDRADALELEHAISDLAHHQLMAGSTDTLEVRRSKALGMLARRETPINLPDLSPEAEQQRATREEWDDLDTDGAHQQKAPAVVSRRRDVTLHVHLTDAALRTGTGIATLEGCTHPISVAQVRSWISDGAPDTTTRVTIRPVLDLAERLETDTYVPSAELIEQTVLRDRTCVFPHCHRDARHCDLDHVTPHGQDPGGTTSSDNLATLCRRHHRLKTHHPGWTYRVLHPGTYLWTTPTGQKVLRDPRGTHPLRAVEPRRAQTLCAATSPPDSITGVRGLRWRLLAWQALDEAMPIFPVYALLFADAGLTLGEISLLLVLWSVVGIVLEVPSGAWADAVSRRLLLALGAVAYGAAFATWVLFPDLVGFAVGFCLWGLSGALTSGTFQALAYDELTAAGARDDYARVIGQGRALAIVALTLTTLAAAPLLAIGGYDLVGWASVGVCAVQLLVVLSLPSAPPTVSAEDVDDLEELDEPPPLVSRPGAWARWRLALRTGLTEATTSALVRGAVLASGTVLALQFLDEYFGLLLREQGAALVLVPVLFGVVSLGEVVGALVATRASGWSPPRVGTVVSVAGALVALAVVVDRPVVAALVLAVGYGLVQLAVVVTEVRLQDSIEAGARATVISTSNVLAEVLSVAAYAAFALGAGEQVGPAILVVGLVVVVLGPVVGRVLPAASTGTSPKMSR